MEPAEGIEPATYRLQGDCSTFELRRRAPIVAALAARGYHSASATDLDLELDLALDALQGVVDRLDSALE